VPHCNFTNKNVLKEIFLVLQVKAKFNACQGFSWFDKIESNKLKNRAVYRPFASKIKASFFREFCKSGF